MINSEQIKEIAARMRSLRELIELTVEDAAAHIGVSAEEYEQFESGTVDIRITILFEIANMLGVELSTLLTGEEPRLKTCTVVRKGEGLKVNRRAEYDYWNLAYDFVGKKAEPFFCKVMPMEKKTLASHPGQEFNYILSGVVEISVGGVENVLQEGDAIYFDSANPHGMRALSEGGAEFIAIVM